MFYSLCVQRRFGEHILTAVQQVTDEVPLPDLGDGRLPAFDPVRLQNQRVGCRR
jgi:hypothetical protein